jgi:hypothetical protein
MVISSGPEQGFFALETPAAEVRKSTDRISLPCHCSALYWRSVVCALYHADLHTIHPYAQLPSL